MKTKPTVLLVDDEENVVSSLKRHLYKEAYKVLITTSGDEAISIVSKQEIHVVLSDMRMPKMSGVELLTKVKEVSPLTTRMILSGQSDLSQIFSAINEGQIYKYICKPADEIELKLSLSRAIEHYELQKERIGLLDELEKKNQELLILNNQLEQKVEERTKTLKLRDEILEYFLSMHSLDDCLMFMREKLIGHFNLEEVNLFLKKGSHWHSLPGEKPLNERLEATLNQLNDGETSQPAADGQPPLHFQHCLAIPEVGKIILEIKARESIERSAIQPFYKFYTMAVQDEYTKTNLPQMETNLDHLIKGIHL